MKCSPIENKKEVMDTKPIEIKTDISYTCEKPRQPEDSNTSYVITTKDKGSKNTQLDEIKEKETQHMNATFDKQTENMLAEMLAQNNTFIMNNVANMTFEKTDNINQQCLGINTTFDKQDTGNTCDDNNDNNATFVQQPPHSEKEQLNVTFEKGGEYKIKSLNETVNLMDAEEQVLQIILDSTPKKPSRASIGHTSTPKSSIALNQHGLKNSVSLHREIYNVCMYSRGQ